MVENIKGRLAVPITAALALLVAPFAMSTAAAVTPGDATPPPVLINGARLGSLQIVKLGASSEVPGDASADGGEVDLGDGRIIRIPGVQFRLERLTAYDLATPEGWLAAKQLASTVAGQEDNLGQLLAGEPKTDPVVGCTGWGDVVDGDQHADLNAHCDGIGGANITGGAEASTGELKFENLPVGIYLVSEQKTPPNVVPAVPFLVTVPMTDPDDPNAWMYDVTVYPKNAMPSLTKTVDDKALALSEGESVTYKIELPLPKDSMTLALTDVLDPRLGFTLEQGALRVPAFEPLDWGSATIDKQSDPEKVTFANGITVEFGTLDHDNDEDTAPRDRVLRVTYPESIVRAVAQDTGTLGFEFDAEVTESGEIPNTASFVVTAPGGTATGETEVVTKWGGFDVQKTTSDGTVLPGAHFNVARSYEDALAKDFIFPAAVVSNDEGLVSFTGLRYSYWEDGKEVAPEEGQVYWLVETQAPLGYELDSTPVQFTVTSQSDGTADVTIKNDRHTGFELPTIGGNRAILPILGALVVGGGVVWLIRSRRVND